MDTPDIESGLQNLSELLNMKDPNTFTTVESSLSRFIEVYFSESVKNRVS